MEPTIRIAALLAAASLCTASAQSPANAGYAARRSWLLAHYRDVDVSRCDPDPKATLLRVLAKLEQTGGKDPQSLEYASRVMDYKSSYDQNEVYGQIFAYPALARFLYMFGDRLTPAQREHLRGGLVRRAKDVLDHGTENHAIMRVASGYLFAQYFPNETWTDRKGVKRTSAELMAEAKRLMLLRGRNFFRFVNNEALSTTYAFINVYPLLTLWEYARDPEVKTAAESLVLFHTTLLAVNDFDGHVMPPYNRQNSQQERFVPRESRNRYTPVTAQIAWLLWGQNEMYPEDLAIPDAERYPRADAPYPILFALSKWRPPAVIDRIAAGAGAPYAIRSSLGAFGPWGAGKRDEVLRMGWRDKDFALGGGALRFDPAGFFQDYSQFQIAWRSKDRFRYLECNQPYWRSNEGEDYWDKGANSPFMQSAVHRNAAIVLFNVPEKDPWPGRGAQKHWPKMRDKHTDRLLAVAQCRFPKSIDQWTRDGDWFFLREGDVYIGIRPLRPGAELKSDFAADHMKDFHVIKSRHARTGFVFEAGTKEQHRTFDAFRKKVVANRVGADWTVLEATYRTSRGDTLKLRYNPDLTESKERIVEAIPDFRVNGTAVDFRNWPALESPPASLGDSVLRIGQGAGAITIDWRGEQPVITRR